MLIADAASPRLGVIAALLFEIRASRRNVSRMDKLGRGDTIEGNTIEEGRYFSSRANGREDRDLERPLARAAASGEIPFVLTRREHIRARGHRLLFYAAMKLSLG